ncbi:MAG: hypothetical protein AB1449_14685, partial [Chloroflexota bacterium]
MRMMRGNHGIAPGEKLKDRRGDQAFHFVPFHTGRSPRGLTTHRNHQDLMPPGSEHGALSKYHGPQGLLRRILLRKV